MLERWCTYHVRKPKQTGRSNCCAGRVLRKPPAWEWHTLRTRWQPRPHPCQETAGARPPQFALAGNLFLSTFTLGTCLRILSPSCHQLRKRNFRRRGWHLSCTFLSATLGQHNASICVPAVTENL